VSVVSEGLWRTSNQCPLFMGSYETTMHGNFRCRTRWPKHIAFTASITPSTCLFQQNLISGTSRICETVLHIFFTAWKSDVPRSLSMNLWFFVPFCTVTNPENINRLKGYKGSKGDSCFRSCAGFRVTTIFRGRLNMEMPTILVDESW
jgi:hypothetical protein